MARRTKEWWAALTPEERSWLVYAERNRQPLFNLSSECVVCRIPVYCVSFCEKCLKKLNRIKQKADKAEEARLAQEETSLVIDDDLVMDYEVIAKCEYEIWDRGPIQGQSCGEPATHYVWWIGNAIRTVDIIKIPVCQEHFDFIKKHEELARLAQERR